MFGLVEKGRELQSKSNKALLLFFTQCPIAEWQRTALILFCACQLFFVFFCLGSGSRPSIAGLGFRIRGFVDSVFSFFLCYMFGITV